MNNIIMLYCIVNPFCISKGYVCNVKVREPGTYVLTTYVNDLCIPIYIWMGS